MTALITLNADEALLIQTIRKSLASTQEAWMLDQSTPVYNKFENIFGQLTHLLIQVDPFVVKLQPLFDTQQILFELQFLYVISEGHKGEKGTLQKLLNCWLSQPYIIEAKYISRLIISVLEKSGLNLQFPDILKQQTLVAATSLLNQPVPLVCIDFQPNKPSEYLRSKTVH